MHVYSQEQIFIFFFIIGIIIGFSYDIFRVFRKALRTPDFITFIQDFAFILISGALIILGIIKLNGGEVRFFLFLGILLGIIIYFLTISNLCVIILLLFVKICKTILKLPIFWLKKFLNIRKYLIKKDFK